jgi:predicted nucleic acid-binding protein
MPFLLDSNVVTQILRRTPHVVSRYRSTLERGEPVFLSALVHYEVKRGLLHLQAGQQLRRLEEDLKGALPWAPVTDADREKAAELWAECRRVGRPHEDDGDLLIAAQAAALGATVVTRNTRDFADLHVTTENWEE